MASDKTPWGGRFEKRLDEGAAAFGASLPVDGRMWEQDIRGSIAHARMLAAQGIIGVDDAAQIELGLLEIYGEIEAGHFESAATDEDIHMAIERALVAKVGDAGKRLHTARSRNDQVALDTRMYAKTACVRLAVAANGLRSTFLRLADEHFGVVMPGYTHMQKAQPVLLSHHLLAYSWMLTRDVARLRAAHVSADVMPLGSAALAGTTFPIDREAVARTLGFAAVTPNSLDAVSDRDFLLDLTYACTVAMVHLSRLCEEIVVWSTDEFGFVVLDDSFSTGSSIMPQKKNPDFAELVRGKSGRVAGDLVSLIVTLKGLPLAYNKDMQEDKEPTFDAIDTLESCLRVVEGMLGTMRVDSERMRAGAHAGAMAATDLADHLAARGVPFREAHEIVGRLVLACEREQRPLQSLTLADLQAASPGFGEDALRALDVDDGVSRRSSQGGTGHDAVRVQMRLAAEALASDAAWAETAGA
jgi:argininosuccinate lyase